MKLYTYIINIIAAVAATAAMTACSDISTDDRFIELPPVEVNRVVLLEEYTGQKCINCPKAHEVMASLLSQYPDNLIAVSIHGGGDMNSFSDRLPFGLRNDQSEAYCSAARVSAFPAGVINRVTAPMVPDLWAASLRTELARPSSLDLDVEARLSSDGTAIEITTEATAYQTMSGRLQIWIVESGIVARQLTDNGYITDYVHNHVFRAAVNGADGQSIRLVNGTPETYTDTIELSSKWAVDNLAVVAFVYDDSGVCQAAKTHVTK